MRQLRFSTVKSSSLRRLPLILLLLLAFSLPANVCFSQTAGDDKKDVESEAADEIPPPTPIGTLSIASIETLNTRIDEFFASIDRPDMSDLVKGFVENNLGGLKGMNPKLPFGAMLFLSTEFPPRPQPVGYIPVDSISDLVKTVELGPTVVKKVDGEDDKYELTNPRRRRNQSMFARMVDGYALVSRSEEYVDADLPSPKAFSAEMTSRYDVGAKLDIDAVPPGIRQTFVGFMRTSTEGQLQQRDEEPDGAFRIRRAAGMRNFKMIERILTQTKNITMGLAKDKNSVGGNFDINITVEPGSEFEEAIKESTARPSRFEVLFSDNALVSGTASSKLDKLDQEQFVEMLGGLETALNANLKEQGVEQLSAMKPMFEALRRTVDERHFDAHIQFDGQNPGEFYMLGALKVFDGQKISAGLKQLLEHAAQQPDAPPILVNDQKIGGVDFHRLEVKEDDLDGTAKTLFGDRPSIYLGVDRAAIWVAFGGSVVPDRLENAMKQVNENAGKVNAKSSRMPFRIMLNAKRWMTLPGAEFPAEMRDVAELALKDDNDALMLDVQPTDDGVRIRFQAQEGLMKMILFALARQYDRNNEL